MRIFNWGQKKHKAFCDGLKGIGTTGPRIEINADHIKQISKVKKLSQEQWRIVGGILKTHAKKLRKLRKEDVNLTNRVVELKKTFALAEIPQLKAVFSQDQLFHNLSSVIKTMEEAGIQEPGLTFAAYNREIIKIAEAKRESKTQTYSDSASILGQQNVNRIATIRGARNQENQDQEKRTLTLLKEFKDAGDLGLVRVLKTSTYPKPGAYNNPKPSAKLKRVITLEIDIDSMQRVYPKRFTELPHIVGGKLNLAYEITSHTHPKTKGNFYMFKGFTGGVYHVPHDDFGEERYSLSASLNDDHTINDHDSNLIGRVPELISLISGLGNLPSMFYHPMNHISTNPVSNFGTSPNGDYISLTEQLEKLFKNQ